MAGNPRSLTRPALPAVVLATCLALGACSDVEEPPEAVFVAPGTTCDRPLDTPRAQTINERVGGLQTPDFTVRFAESTRAGNVALVTGDVKKAYDMLSADYEVTVVAELEDDGSGRIVGFEQVRSLVDDICPG